MPTIAGDLIINDRVTSMFWERVSKTDGCWIWSGNRSPRGYGRIKVKGITRLAHRFSWALHYGLPPSDMMVCHTCDNPSCVNPSHLFIGTAKDNAKDMIDKGRKVIVKGDDVYNAKLTNQDVVEMRRVYSLGQKTAAEIAVDYGVTKEVARNAIKGITWKHVPGAVCDIPRKKGARRGVYIGEESYAAKLSTEQVLRIRCLYKAGFSQKQISEITGVSSKNIHLIVNNKTWKHLS